jgi:metal-responsive CopG/Arc/MetJ family transcriptional regulator
VSNTITVRLPKHLVKAIDDYLDTDWSDRRDALNAVAYIGEYVAKIRARSRYRKGKT